MTTLELAADLISRIPETLQGVLVTGIVAVIIMAVQNRSNRANLRLQIAKESDEKDKDRKISYRKEVYLNYVAQGTKAFIYIGTLPFRDIATENPMVSVSEFSSAIAQTGLIVNDETSLMLVEMNKEFTLFIMGAMERMRPLSELASKASLLERRFQFSINEQTRASTEALLIAESGTPNKVKSENLRMTFDRQSKQLQQIQEERAATRREVVQLQYLFVEYILENMRGVGDLQIAIAGKLRLDLGIETDIAKLKAEMDKARDVVMVESKRLIDAMHAKETSLEEPAKSENVPMIS